MKRSRFTEEQIIAVLREHEGGVKTADLCRKHGISSEPALEAADFVANAVGGMARRMISGIVASLKLCQC